ncbi:X2-like carbohydrate binding domain-containing protein [Paenibacillus typhae]|uniref:Alpha-galactosidase n=1 Tax=Paenibacillus typhae TaxID=1174501 RepID=A0A1G8SA28_9BACL|nr:X2-like carbohydrate binding domain-containing protein [Paenibacillus typhae]SDJ26043.1 S-layer homology domain-containing protein [Paenibacillus typhae]
MKSLAKRIGVSLLLCMMVAVQAGVAGITGNVAEAADKALAQKPYMGWSSYSMQVYEPSGNWISAERIKEQSDAMHEKLQAYGYEYINIDAGWNGGMDEYGRPIPNAERYPDGFQEVIDYVHNNGQKIGIYLIPGVSIDAYNQNLEIYGTNGECRIQDITYKPLTVMDYWNSYTYKIDFTNPCAQKYVDSIADLLGEWGIDFVKFDSVTPGSGINNLSRDARGDVEAWSKALDRHDIWFELSWALDHNYADFWKQYANGWRIHWDVESYDSSVGLTQWANIARLFPEAAIWWREAGPGGWNDFDSLNVGNGAMDGLTRDERQTAMTFWAVSAAQLYIGNDMTRLDDYGMQLLTNEEVIAVNQAGHPAHPVSMNSQQQVWYANNGDGTYNVALFNLGSRSAAVDVNWSDIGLEGPASVRDLWSRSELGTFGTGFSSGPLEPHASRLLKVTAKSGASIVNDDDTNVRYTGSWKRNGGKEQTPASQDIAVTVSESAQPPGGGNPAEPGGGTVTQAVYINDSDSGIVYSGAWSSQSGRPHGDYRGDVHYTETDGDYFEYTFKGTGIDLLTEKDSSQGDILVYLDDEASPQTVSTYTPGAKEAQQVVYSMSGLADEEHTLKVVKGSGQYMLLDALRISVSRLLDPASAEFDKAPDKQADVTVSLPAGSDSLLEVRNGTAVLAKGGDYTVSRNGVTIRKDYLYNLPSGKAELTFMFDGGASAVLEISITGSAMVRYSLINNDDPAIVYNGSWSRSTGRGMGDYKDDVQYAEQNGDSFEYTFSGTGIQLYTEKDASQGDMDIYVDGEFKETVSAYNNGRLAQQNLYSITGLPEGLHTLKAVKKSGSFMLLDMLKVEIPDLINPVEAVFDKAAPAGLEVKLLREPSLFGGIRQGTYTLAEGTDYTLTGDTVTVKQEYLAAQPEGMLQLTFAFNGDYLNDVHYTEADGDYLEYTFSGTGISMSGPKGPELGNMDIYLDGEFIQTVSAYSSERQVLQKLFSLGGLSSGVHVLKAVKASGSLMLSDQLSYTVGGGTGGPTDPGGQPTPAPSATATPAPTAAPSPVPAVPGGVPAATASPSVSPSATPSAAPGPSASPAADQDAGKQHEAYISGYPDGLFKPEQKITRAEMAALLVKAAARESGGAVPAFSDIKAGHWAAEAITGAAAMGLMNGYPDGSFRPDRQITRAELASLVVLLGNITSAPGAGYSDVTAGHWAESAIRQAQGAGILKGYADGTFRPGQAVTRAEAVTAVNRAFGRGPLSGAAASPWLDVPLTHWAFGDILEASMDHTYTEKSGGGEELGG